MNKQAFTFLTLFTLVLMLAVYYVTLPLEDPSVVSDDLIVSIDENNQINTLLNDLDNKHSTNIDNEEEVVSNNDSTIDEKLDALDEINLEKETLNQEIALQESLVNQEFDGCLVEIETEVVRVMCPDDYESKNNAIKLMSTIYNSVDKEVLVEVSFD